MLCRMRLVLLDVNTKRTYIVFNQKNILLRLYNLPCFPMIGEP